LWDTAGPEVTLEEETGYIKTEIIIVVIMVVAVASAARPTTIVKHRNIVWTMQTNC